MNKYKNEIKKYIEKEFKEYLEISKILIQALEKAKIPDEFDSFCYFIGNKISKIFNSDMVHSNWYNINCGCDKCMRLDYPGDFYPGEY
uniref:Uncharacterized protein n=1 Tax=viral metagenome TaxID=1070528 RepID=A0A6M3XDK8_9ZZZZ